MAAAIPSSFYQDVAVASTGALLIAVLASVLLGNQAILVLGAVVLLVACVGRASVRRRLATAVATLLVGGQLGSMAHWVFFDNQSLAAIYKPDRAVARTVASVAIGAALLMVANWRRSDR